nr:uroporphyrinogen-III synthase [Actinomadura sp. CNU-125]
MQLYGERQPELTGALRAAGAVVVEVPVYRWAPADDPTPLHRLVGQAVAGTVDAITFTSAPALAATLAAAAADGLAEPLLEAMRGPLVAACVGPVTAAELTARGVPTVQPERARLGALAADAGRRPAPAAGPAAAGPRAGAGAARARVVLDGQLRPIAPAPMAILRALARRPGHVVSRSELSGALPGRPGCAPPTPRGPAVRRAGRASAARESWPARRPDEHAVRWRSRGSGAAWAVPGSWRRWSSAATGSRATPARAPRSPRADRASGRSRHPDAPARPLPPGRSRQAARRRVRRHAAEIAARAPCLGDTGEC